VAAAVDLGTTRDRPTFLVPGEFSGHVDPDRIAGRLAPAVRWAGAFEAGVRRWRLLARTDDFDAWVIAWPQGGRVELHDHGPSRGALVVLEGSLVESVPWRDDGGMLTLARNLVRPGRILRLDAGHVHDVTNESRQPALSVHVYAPPLAAMTHYDIVGNRLLRRGARGRVADAVVVAG
jgi:mannose-6-phosphate isomerase-like protein (cupin superfamily)